MHVWCCRVDQGLARIVDLLRQHRDLAEIGRIVFARYDAATNILVKDLCSEDGACAMVPVFCDLDATPFLAILASGSRPRVIDCADGGGCELLPGDSACSVAVPLWRQGGLTGMVFVDSPRVGYFDPHRADLVAAVVAILAPMLVRPAVAGRHRPATTSSRNRIASAAAQMGAVVK